jgi:hypothetical protein
MPSYEFASGPSHEAGPDVGLPEAGPDAPPDGGQYDASDAPVVTLLTDCVLLLHMEETTWSGANAVKDSSGQGNHGTAAGNTTTVATGKFGRGAAFDGSGWIEVTHRTSMNVTDKLTVAAWIYPTGLTDGSPSPGIVSKRRGFNDNVAFTLFIYANNQAYADVHNARFNSSFVLSNSSWFHVALVYDGTLTDVTQRAKLYIDGKLDRTNTADATIPPNTENLRIGDLPGGGNTFIGRIDEVAMWTRALSSDEIKKLAEATGPL